MKKYFLIAILLILLDQILKNIITNCCFFEKNYGMVFGLLQGKIKLIILLSFFAIGFLIYYANELKNWNVYGLSLIIAGIVGNLADRMVYGYVIDYIHIWIWPAFNLADIFNVLGVIILIFNFKNAKHI